MLKLVADQLRSGIATDGWAMAKLAEMQLLARKLAKGVAKADEATAEKARQTVRDAYNHGAAQAVNDLRDVDLDLGALPQGASAEELGDAVAAKVKTAWGRVPIVMRDLYQDAVQAGVAEVLGGKVTRVQAAQHVLDRVASRGITGFVDKAGRDWSLTSYLEMATRTGAGQAAVDGHLETLAGAGVDLVIVSDSPRECPLCRPWEGKVLSQSGQVGAVIAPSAVSDESVRVNVAGSVDDARADGLLHPNCTHTLDAYLPGVTDRPKPQHDPEAYEAKQRQRAMERKVREWKRRQAVALTDDAAEQAAVKVRQWQKALREHVDAHDLKRLRRREQTGTAI